MKARVFAPRVDDSGEPDPYNRRIILIPLQEPIEGVEEAIYLYLHRNVLQHSPMKVAYQDYTKSHTSWMEVGSVEISEEGYSKILAWVIAKEAAGQFLVDLVSKINSPKIDPLETLSP